MKRSVIIACITLSVLSVFVSATADTLADVLNEEFGNENVIYYNTDETFEGEPLIKVVHIQYAEPKAPEKKLKEKNFYILANYRWPLSKYPLIYTINPINFQGLSEEFITKAISNAAENWDSKNHTEIFSDSYVIDYTARGSVYDHKNTIAFDDSLNGAIVAMAFVYYKSISKTIVEFDQLYNTKYVWGDALLQGRVMDLENIATHEFGHAIGLRDLYNSECRSATMYGYTRYGETTKRSLEKGDIRGLKEIFSVKDKTSNKDILKDADQDGLPGWWEQRYFSGSTNANPTNVAANGVNTVMQAYIAGLDPTNPGDFFNVSQSNQNGFVVQWSPCVSGRVYSVYWASNLLSGFQCVESNISWTQMPYTDAVHNAEGEGFYKIDVQLGE